MFPGEVYSQHACGVGFFPDFLPTRLCGTELVAGLFERHIKNSSRT
jgi:hypothetical protein